MGGTGGQMANEDGMYAPVSGGEVPVPDSSLSAGESNDDDSSSWFGMPAPLDVAANAVGAATTSLVQSHSETEVKQKESALRGKIMQLQAVLKQNQRELNTARAQHTMKKTLAMIQAGKKQPVHPVPEADFLHAENAAGDKMLNAPYMDPYAPTKPYMPAYYEPVDPGTQTEAAQKVEAGLMCPYDGATGKPNKAYYLQTCGEWCWDHREKKIVDDMQFTVPAELDYTSSGVHAPATAFGLEDRREVQQGFSLMKKGAEEYEGFAVPDEKPAEAAGVEEVDVVVPVEEIVVVEEEA
jgi:hypothetical protein